MLNALLWQSVCQEEKERYLLETVNLYRHDGNLSTTALILFVCTCILLSLSKSQNSS